MAVRFSPKILGLNVGMFGTVFGQSRTVFEIGFSPGTNVFGFFLCVLVFGVVFSLIWQW